MPKKFNILKHCSSKESKNVIKFKKSLKLNPSSYKKALRRLNPSIFSFSYKDSFIYQSIHCNFYYDKLTNNNLIKPSNEELANLNNIINSLKYKETKEHIYILPFFKFLFDNIKKIEPERDEKAKKINEIIMNWPKESNISIIKITDEYNKFASLNNKRIIHKSQVHLIMKNILNLRFRKTSIKTTKLLLNKSILQSFFFIKIILRGLLQNFKFIFIDESGFSTKNNNYKTWRFQNQEIYYPNETIKKLNLIIGVSQDKVFHYSLNEQNTTSKKFKEFMIGMLKKMTEEEKKNHILILDNCTSHLTAENFDLYKTNKLKILFGVPYLSKFNMVENIFRYIKNYTYKRLYKNITILGNDIKDIIDNNVNKNLLDRLFKEVLIEYQEYIKEKINNDLDIIS
jgi:hypothetical protein